MPVITEWRRLALGHKTQSMCCLRVVQQYYQYPLQTAGLLEAELSVLCICIEESHEQESRELSDLHTKPVTKSV